MKKEPEFKKKEIRLRDDWDSGAKIVDVKTAEVSHGQLWLFSMSKVDELQITNMVVLNMEEANKLLEFLKEAL